MIREVSIVGLLLLAGCAGLPGSTASEWSAASTVDLGTEERKGGCWLTADVGVADGETVFVYQHARADPAEQPIGVDVLASNRSAIDPDAAMPAYAVSNVTVLAVEPGADRADTLATRQISMDCSIEPRGGS